MSLINQVLQDLEKRHASEPELRALPPHVRAVPAPARSFPVARTLAVMVVVAGIVAAAARFGGPLVQPEPAAVVAPPPPAPAPAPTPAVTAPAGAPAPEPELVQTLPPASRLSEELSFVPESRPRKAAAKPGQTPARPAPVTPPAIPEESRAAVEPSAAPTPAPPAAVAQSSQLPAAAPVTPAPSSPPAAQPPATEGPPAIDKQMREMTASQRAELAFRRGVEQLREARASAAEASFREALREDQNHVAARQALLGLLLDARRNDEAEQLLRTALALNPRQPRHAMVLARLQVDRGEVPGAINTLVGALPYVQSDPEYYAFLAALLQREGRHKETVDYYRAALQVSPGNAVWLMGLGISQRAMNQAADARDSFQRALDTRQLKGDLLAFTERQLRELGAPRK